MTMRELILVEIADIPHKHSDVNRYTQARYRLHQIAVQKFNADPSWNQRTINQKYNLHTFDYSILNDEDLLSMFECLLILQYSQG